MPFVNSFASVNFINKSVQPTGTPDIDAAWLNYIQSIIDTQGDGLATYSSSLEALQATVTALGNPYTDPGHINGLDVEWVTGTQIRIKSGGCYIPATGTIVSKATDTTVNLSGLSANTWYYLYAANLSGALAFDAPSTTTPVAYFGTAKQKSGDSSRRYIGEFKTAPAATTALKYRVVNDRVFWMPTGNNIYGTPYITGINNTRSTTSTNYSVASAAPTGAKAVQLIIDNETNSVHYISDTSVSDSSTPYMFYSSYSAVTPTPQTAHSPWIPLDDSLQFRARSSGSATTGGVWVAVMGYERER